MSINELFNQPLKVINTGLQSFKDNLQHVGVPVVQVEWNLVDDFDSSNRGNGGFGSTGVA